MVVDSILRLYDEMYQAEKRAADFILQNPTRIISMNVSEVSRESDASEATIVRFCKRLGYTGFHQLKLTLASEYGYGENERNKDDFRPDDVNGYLSLTATRVLNLSKNINTEAVEACVD